MKLTVVINLPKMLEYQENTALLVTFFHVKALGADGSSILDN